MFVCGLNRNQQQLFQGEYTFPRLVKTEFASPSYIVTTRITNCIGEYCAFWIGESSKYFGGQITTIINMNMHAVTRRMFFGCQNSNLFCYASVHSELAHKMYILSLYQWEEYRELWLPGL
jgi:hypothetical protein